MNSRYHGGFPKNVRHSRCYKGAGVRVHLLILINEGIGKRDESLPEP